MTFLYIYIYIPFFDCFLPTHLVSCLLHLLISCLFLFFFPFYLHVWLYFVWVTSVFHQGLVLSRVWFTEVRTLGSSYTIEEGDAGIAFWRIYLCMLEKKKPMIFFCFMVLGMELGSCSCWASPCHWNLSSLLFKRNFLKYKFLELKLLG